MSARASKASGDAFEAWIDSQHAMAMHIGVLAHIEHNQPHSKVIGGRVIYTRAGVADYTGVLHTTGTYLAVEAKHTAALRLPRSSVRPLQAAHLTAVAKAGGLALLLVEFQTSRLERFAIPWLEVPWKQLRTAESITAADVSAWKIDPRRTYLDRSLR